jgi:hypothetical protein
VLTRVCTEVLYNKQCAVTCAVAVASRDNNARPAWTAHLYADTSTGGMMMLYAYWAKMSWPYQCYIFRPGQRHDRGTARGD